MKRPRFDWRLASLCALFASTIACGPIRGDFVMATAAPQPNGQAKLWILTDGGFHYRIATQTMSSYTNSPECVFCKSLIYVYDPVTQQVQTQFELPRKDLAEEQALIFAGGKVWFIAELRDARAVIFSAYDPQSTARLFDSDGFFARHPELAVGIATLSIDTELRRVDLKLRDGTERLLLLDSDELVDKQSPAARAAVTRTWSLRPTDAPERRGLFRQGARASSDVYLSGIIYREDEDGAYIVHLDNVGRRAARLLTRVDARTGAQLWTQRQLLPGSEIDEDEDSFSNVFFSKNKIRVLHAAGFVFVQMQGAGIQCLDGATGQQRWTLRL